MAKNIRGAGRIHAVGSPEELAGRHAAEIRKRADAGLINSAIPFEVKRTVHARVDGGEWLFDCDCAAGVAVEPGWPAAHCFACGAVFTNVKLPKDDDRLNIEHVLTARRYNKNRWWRPGETLVDLAIENAEHGVRF